MKAWIFQRKAGPKNPWSVGWYTPDGRRKEKQIGTKTHAQRFKAKVESELAGRTYQEIIEIGWKDFRREYEEQVVKTLAVSSRDKSRSALDSFERIAKPVKVMGITTQMIDRFISIRKTESGRKPGSVISPATVNRELRTIKAALNKAVKWKYILECPDVQMLRQYDEVGQVMSEEHFQLIYDACDSAEKPEDRAGDWWRALLTFSITTGWRIDEILSLRRDDLDLETGIVRTRAKDNKGKRDDFDRLRPEALDAIKKIITLAPTVFDWRHHKRTLYSEFAVIQHAAGIKLECPDAESHECTEACHLYGFHSLRRAYATFNASILPAPTLQKKMRHRSYQTTLGYIQMADKVLAAADDVYVPKCLQKKA